MTLVGASRHFLVWLHQVILAFGRTDFFVTWMVILASVGARLTNLGAFILPLKVILLVGSAGVPRYFQGFISEETRSTWIVGLSLFAVALYLISITLEALAKRYSMIGSGKVLREANTLVVMHNQDGVAQGYYSRFCSAYASLLFVLILLGAGLYLHTWLYFAVASVVATEAILSATFMGRLESRSRNAFATYMASNSANFLAILASINFLLVFGWLVAEFLVFDRGNVLIAILSIMIARQLFSNISLFVTQGVRLTAEKARINALIFKAHRVQNNERSESQRVRLLFDPAVRAARTAELLGLPEEVIHSRWCDKSGRGIATFELSLGCEHESLPSKLCEIVYAPSCAHLVENEDILFQHLEPAALKRPQLIRQYEVDGFVGRIYDHGAGRAVELSDWVNRRSELMAHFWSVQPSRALKELFCASKLLLHERITPELIARLEIAIDDESEARPYQQLRERLSEFRATLAALPLFVHNPELSSEIVALTASDEELIMRWGRWSLEPIGAGMEPRAREILWLSGVYPELVKNKVLPDRVTLDHLLVASRFWQMERLIYRDQFKAAIQLVPQLVSAGNASACSETRLVAQ